MYLNLIQHTILILFFFVFGCLHVIDDLMCGKYMLCTFRNC